MSAWSRRGESEGSNSSRSPFTVFGLLFLAVGAYLLVDPSVATEPVLGIDPQRLINLQLLVVGQTLTLMGTILLAVAWRPIVGAGNNR